MGELDLHGGGGLICRSIGLSLGTSGGIGCGIGSSIGSGIGRRICRSISLGTALILLNKLVYLRLNLIHFLHLLRHLFLDILNFMDHFSLHLHVEEVGVGYTAHAH